MTRSLMFMRLMLTFVLPIHGTTSWILTAHTSEQGRCRYVTSSSPTPSFSVLLRMSSEEANANENKDESLLIGSDAIQQQMAQLRAKYPTSESAFLAAARARNAAKPESVNSQANDDDWNTVAAEQRAKYGNNGIIDDWENSAAEAGSIESQILIPEMPSEDEEDNEEPKLLLF